jgi:hypothetical protein
MNRTTSEPHHSKKGTGFFRLFVVGSLIFLGCGERASNQETKVESSVDICRCLTEPGNSDWAIAHKDACRDAISKELGVDNYEKVNFSQNPELSKKFDDLAKKCTGSTEVETRIEAVDRNSELVKHIGRASGYVWESINIPAQLYTTLTFDGLEFGTIGYSMNGKTNSEDFSKIIELSGTWSALNPHQAEGELSGTPVGWTFSDDYSTLTNNKGVVFKRIKVSAIR